MHGQMFGGKRLFQFASLGSQGDKDTHPELIEASWVERGERKNLGHVNGIQDSPDMYRIR